MNKILIGVFFYIFLYLTANAGENVIYPIKIMSKVECRFQDFSTLNDDCKMSLPVLLTKDYTKYKNDYSLYRRVYTVLWGSTYTYGRDIGNGGHSGVDIATAKGTPVYSIYEGEVVTAGNLTGRGNTVKIKHTINGKKIYSNYSHLSSINVKVGDKVNTNTEIGKVGNTGNSYGNHLHFQIDLAVSGKGPRYRSNCKEKKYDNIINTNVCFSQLNTNTIDPLLFIESTGQVVKNIEKIKPTVQNISSVGMISREEILKREMLEFLSIYEVKVDMLGLSENIKFKDSGSFRISVTDKRTKKPFNGSFPGYMYFKYDNKRFDIFPTGILQIDNGIRDFKITPKMIGKMSLDIYLGETFFKNITFGSIDPNKPLKIQSPVLDFQKESVIGDNNKSKLFFKDSYGISILGHKFDGKLKLYSLNNSAKFCLKKVNLSDDFDYVNNTKCSERAFKDSLEFSYEDTSSGRLLFEYKVINIGLNTINLDLNNKKLSTYNILGTNPNGVDINSVYYESIINILKYGISSGIYNGYFMEDRDLSTLDGVNMLMQLLDYKLSLCLDETCKNFYLEKLNNVSKIQTDKYTYFNRGDYLKLLGENTLLTQYLGDDFINFRDLKEESLKYSKNILKNKTWNDYYGKTKYFQPDKVISRGEGAYLLDNILKN